MTDRLRILVRSDSQGVSLGEGAVDHDDPRLWPSALQRELTERGLDVEVINASTLGLTIRDALDGYRNDPLVRQAFDASDVVIVGLGINDWWPLARPKWLADGMQRVRPLRLRHLLEGAYRRIRPKLLELAKGRFRPTPPAEARRSLDALIAELEAAHDTILVTPFPVRSPKNPLLDGNTAEAAAAVLDAGARAGVTIVDTHILFEPISWEQMARDHIHVNEDGHVMLAREVAATLDAHGKVRSGRGRPDDTAGGPRVLLRTVDTAVGELAAGIEAALHSEGLPAATVIDGCSPLLRDIEYALRSTQYDPLVHDRIAAANVTVLGVRPSRRAGAYFEERLDLLVDVTRQLTDPVLLVPADDSRLAAVVRRVAARHGVTTVDADGADAITRTLHRRLTRLPEVAR